MAEDPTWPGHYELTSDLEALRRTFNDLRYFDRALSGDLSILVRRDSHPEPSPVGHPSCTRSQFVLFVDGETLVAAAHLYLLPDGSLGGSGKPDPRVVVTDDGRVLQWRPNRPSD